MSGVPLASTGPFYATATFLLIYHSVHTCSVWRHWGCVTPKIISNIKNSVGDVEDLDGFDDLKDDDKDRLRHAFEEGKVADADIPATARKPTDDEGEKSKRKRAPAKKAEADTDEGGEEKPKKAPARKSRAKVSHDHHYLSMVVLICATESTGRLI